MRDFVISYVNELSLIKMTVSVMALDEFLLINVPHEIHSNITANAHWCIYYCHEMVEALKRSASILLYRTNAH